MTLTNYWWLLIWLFTGGAALAMFFPRQQELVLGKWEQRWNIVPAILLVLPYIIWAGNRTSFIDTGAYRNGFWQSPTIFAQIPGYMSIVTKDKGFSFMTALLHCLLGDNSVAYFTIIATFQLLIIVFVYRKFSCNYWLSIFIFIASTDYISWVQNGIRQFIAVTIVFGGTEFIVKRKYVKAVMMVLIASLFHQSALLMLPVIFVVQGKPWNKKTLIAIALSLLALIFTSRFTTILDWTLSDTQYVNVVSDWTQMNDDGTNPLRILVYAMPMIFSIIGRKRIQTLDDSLINVGVNASIITTCIGVISMGTSGIFIGRLPIYVSLISNGILLPWEIVHIFEEKTQKLITGIAICCYVIFFYYQMHVAWRIL